MKILQVTMQFGRSYRQGTERYVATLSDALRSRGHEVAVLAGDPLRLGPKQPLGEPVYGEANLLYYPTRGWMSLMGLPPRRLAAWLKKHRPDVVHLNTPAHIGAGMIAACRRAGIPCVVTVHDYWWICPKGTLLRPGGAVCDGTPGWMTCVRCLAGDHPRGWVRKLSAVPLLSSFVLIKLYSLRALVRGMSVFDAWRWMWRRRFLIRQLDAANCVIFPSKAVAMAIASRLSHSRWKVIPNGLPAEWFAQPRPTSEQVKPPAEFIIGFSGALSPHKAPHLLLEALHQLGWRDTPVKIAGQAADEAYAERLHALAEGLNVEFVGPVDAKEMPVFLRRLDVLAMTSVWPENCPYAVLEGQAAGVPVVGSRCGGVVELIDNKRLLFEPGSAGGLAAVLDFVRLHPQAGASARVSTAEEMTDAVVEIYRKALASTGCK